MGSAADFDIAYANLKWRIAYLNFKVAAGRFRAWRCKYSDDQPRVPAGSSEGGRWTSASSSGSVHTGFADRVGALSIAPGQILSDADPDPILPGAQYAQARTAITRGEGAVTGISQIDETTDHLSKTLARIMEGMDYIPQEFGPVYGIAVHAAFAADLKAQNLPGVGKDGVEQSFDIFGIVTRYGAASSIRTDVVLRGAGDDILAIYDVKTGGATLSASRAAELRARTNAGPDTPVIELHFERGASLKHEPFEENEWLALEAYSGLERLRGTPRGDPYR